MRNHLGAALIAIFLVNLTITAEPTENDNVLPATPKDSVVHIDIDAKNLQAAGQISTVYSVSYSPNGRWIAAGGGSFQKQSPGELHVWDAAKGKLEFAATFPSDDKNRQRILCVAFSPDSTRLAAVTELQNVRVWDVEKRTQLFDLKIDPKQPSEVPDDAHPVRNYALAFNPSGKLLAVVGDGELRIWDVVSGKPHVAPNTNKRIDSLAFSTDGQRLFAVSQNALCSWNLKSNEELFREELPAQPWRLTLSRDGSSIVLANSGLRIHSSDTGAKLVAWDENRKNIYQAAFSPDGLRLAAAGDDRMVDVWDTRTRWAAQKFGPFPHASLSVAYDPLGRHLAVGWGTWTNDSPGGVTIYDASTGAIVLTLGAPASPDPMNVVAADKVRKALEVVVQSQPGTEQQAIDALKSVTAKNKSIVMRAVGVAQGWDGRRRSLAIRALAQICEDAPESLLTAASDRHARVRGNALQALSLLPSRAPGISEIMKAGLTDPDSSVRRDAAAAMVRLAKNDSSLMNDLPRWLNDQAPELRRNAIETLGKVGPPAEATVPALVAALAKLDRPTRRLTLIALGRIHSHPDLVLPELEACLGEDDAEIVRASLGALEEFGKAAESVLPGIIPLLKHQDGSVRGAAAQSLWQIAPGVAQSHLGPRFDSVRASDEDRKSLHVGSRDWPQWGGSRMRNNTPHGDKIPVAWDIATGLNIKWSASVGSQTFGNPAIANGKVFMGTNNGTGYLERYPAEVDLGVLLCFTEETGKFLWQYSSEKLPTGRVNDWMLMGLPSTPVVDGDRLWFVTNRCEVVCADTDGFLDGQNDGPFRDEPNENRDEADVLWKLDMMREFGVRPHNMSQCSIVVVDGRLFVCTSNGVDDSHSNIPAPQAPSFISLDQDTGKVLWKDNSPGANIHHGQWASPSYGVLGGRPQVLFPGGDGWLYSFDPAGDGDGKSKLLWRFDCNLKNSKLILGGRGTRNEPIAFACIYDGLVYIATGQDPEHGEGEGHLWCIDPGKKFDGSDVSADLVVDLPGNVAPRRRMIAVNAAEGERVIPNPDTAVVWHYSGYDQNADGRIDFEEQFHRSVSTPVILDDILYIADYSGLVHCLNAKTGDAYWTFDQLAACWGSALVVDGKVYIGDEDGDVTVFRHSANPEVAMPGGNPLAELTLLNSVYSTPVVANNILYLGSKTHLHAIAADALTQRSESSASDWPQWRGAKGTGVSAAPELPLTWSRTGNVAWRTPLPGIGSGTPIVWHDRVFVTSYSPDGAMLVCLSDDGTVLWKRKIGESQRSETFHFRCPGPSPLTDGTRVWGLSADGVLIAFDFDGNALWSVNLAERYGKLQLNFGLTSTPIVFGHCLYLQLIHGDGDPDTHESVVLALDKRTGTEIWKQSRVTGASGEREQAYASPIIRRDHLLVSHGADYTIGHDLITGREIWRCRVSSNAADSTLRLIASPVIADDGTIFSPSAKAGSLVALNPLGKGDISVNGIRWRSESGTPDVPSLLSYNDLVYSVQTGGSLLCLDAKSGVQVYREKLASRSHTASPVAAADRIYIVGRDGRTTVVKAGRIFAMLADNDLHEDISASPAIAHGRIYLRTHAALWALEAKRE